MLPFICAKNLSEKVLFEDFPWEFSVPEEQNPFRKLPKARRRAMMLRPTTEWNIYSAFKGISPTERISKTNPPGWAHGLTVDYDMVASIETVIGFLNQMSEKRRPNFIEKTLSGKIRLVWVFERPILVPNSEFCNELIAKFHEVMGLPTLLAG